MTAAPPPLIPRLQAARQTGATLALLFDFDGTLAPLVSHPHLAAMPATLRADLPAIAAIPGVTVGLISGRALDDLARQAGPALPYLAGSGGMELLLKGERRSHPSLAAANALLSGVATAVSEAVQPWPAAWLESKPAALALHFRAVPVAAQAELIVEALEVLEPWADDVTVLTGPSALEILPRVGWHKGDAVRQIAAHAGGSSVFPAYAGDAENDAAAFEAVGRLGGIAIAVGPGAPTAEYAFTDPGALGRWVGEFRVALEERTSSGS